jgi:hypothetical protein
MEQMPLQLERSECRVRSKKSRKLAPEHVVAVEILTVELSVFNSMSSDALPQNANQVAFHRRSLS